MRKKPDDPDFKNLTQVEKVIRRGTELTGHLLTFGQRIAPMMKPLKLNDLLLGSRAELRDLFPSQVKIDFDLAENLKTIKGDVGQIKQVLLNLTRNASRAMPDGGCLFIQTEHRHMESGSTSAGVNVPAGLYVLMSVSDTGQGMPPEIKARVFEPFFTTRTQKKGAGLGLSVAYSIIKNHGGFMDCESRPGEGTVFHIYFPAMPAESD